MVESGKTTLSSQIVQLPDTPTNFHCPSTSRSTKLAKSLNPFPQLPERERIKYDSDNNISWTFVYSIHQASSRFLHSKCFSKISPSNSPQCQKIWLGFDFKAQDPSKYQISLRSGHPFVSYKYLNFQNYPPPNSTKESRSGPVMSVTYLRQVSILPIQFHPDLTTLSIF